MVIDARCQPLVWKSGFSDWKEKNPSWVQTTAYLTWTIILLLSNVNQIRLFQSLANTLQVRHQQYNKKKGLNMVPTACWLFGAVKVVFFSLIANSVVGQINLSKLFQKNSGQLFLWPFDNYLSASLVKHPWFRGNRAKRRFIVIFSPRPSNPSICVRTIISQGPFAPSPSLHLAHTHEFANMAHAAPFQHLSHPFCTFAGWPSVCKTSKIKGLGNSVPFCVRQFQVQLFDTAAQCQTEQPDGCVTRCTLKKNIPFKALQIVKLHRQ